MALLKDEWSRSNEECAKLQKQLESSTDEEKDQLIVEMNAILEGKLSAETRCLTVEQELQTLRLQLSEYDKVSAREQADIVKAAEHEMNSLRLKLQEMVTSSSFLHFIEN